MLTFEETCIAATTLHCRIDFFRNEIRNEGSFDKKVVEVFLSVLTWNTMRRLDSAQSFPTEVHDIHDFVRDAAAAELNNMPDAREIIHSMMINYPIERLKQC